MKTGTSRIVWGVVLTALFGLGTLRNAVLLPLAFAVNGPSSYLIGSAIGAVVAAVVLVLAIRLIRTGLRQRAEYQRALTRPAIPGRF